MSRHCKKYAPQPFEAVGKSFKGIHSRTTADTSTNVYESMLQSPAFKDLNSKQKILYVYLKAQFYGKRKPEKDYPDITEFQGSDKFYFNWDLAKLYGLYKESCNSNFRRDMKVLVEHGFIEIVSSGKNHRTKTIYRYSMKWQFWKK